MIYKFIYKISLANSKIRTNLNIGFAIFLFFHLCIIQRADAQTPCDDPAQHIYSISEFGSAAYALGDIVVNSTALDHEDISVANWNIGTTAEVQAMASVHIMPGAIVRVRSGAILDIYGMLINEGYLFIEEGAVVNFYGPSWTNAESSVVGDGAASTNEVPGGRVNFIAPRPIIPITVGASPCVMTNYSGGDFIQAIDGANVPMDIILSIQNANNVELVNTATKISGHLEFAIEDGDLMLHDQDLGFDTYAGYYWTIPDAKEAYIITNSDDTCLGRVAKEGLAPGENFVFPIGLSETNSLGQRNFSPAVIQNEDSLLVETVWMDVKNHAFMIGLGYVLDPPPSEAEDHYWRIQTLNGGRILTNMIHQVDIVSNDLNEIFNTGGSGFAPVIHILEMGATRTKKGGPRSLGGGTGSVGGIISATGGYDVDMTSAICNDDGSWFTKSEDIFEEMYDFDLMREGCEVKVHADIHLLAYINTVEVHRWDSAASDFVPIGDMDEIEENSYEFVDEHPKHGINVYALNFIMGDDQELQSESKEKFIDCTSIFVFPNPTEDIVYVNGLSEGQHIKLYTVDGKLLDTRYVHQECEQLDLSHYPSGTYMIVVTQGGDSRIAVFKVVKIN